jgi:hypothetical protein
MALVPRSHITLGGAKVIDRAETPWFDLWVSVAY